VGGRAFRRALQKLELFRDFGHHWDSVMVIALTRRWTCPPMHLENAVNVCFAIQFSIISGLMNVETIIPNEHTALTLDTHAFKRCGNMRVDLGNELLAGFNLSRGHGEVIDLSAD
jgi:hypothetical protein